MVFTAVAYSLDGRWLAGGQIKLDHKKKIKKEGYESHQLFYFGEVLIWDAATGELKATLNDENHQAWALTFSPDGKFLAVGSGPIVDDEKNCKDLCQGYGGVLLWETSSWKPPRRLKGNSALIFSLAFSPDGRFVAGGADGVGLRDKLEMMQNPDVNKEQEKIEIIVWDAVTGDRVKSMTGHTKTITAIAFSPDGNWLVSTGKDHLLNIWNGRTWEFANVIPVYPLPGALMGLLSGKSKEYQGVRLPLQFVWLNAIVFTPGSQELIGGGNDGFI